MVLFYRFMALIILCVFPLAVFARDIVITVEDEDLKMPLEGAVISLRDGTRFVCNEDGTARITLPDDRQTLVQITYPGYETIRLTIPASDGSVLRLNVLLRLGGVMQSRELVVEAQRPETSETQTGRSVVIAERELARTAEIGIIEDVMSAVKLLPGVGYTGMFGAQPSIRGGDPGDLVTVFDGFYLERPYHWIGAVSIFDPKMVTSARLSHGVFSSRYGHSISGLLDITSKSPSPTEMELETGISTSSASLNLSYPLNGRGGVLFMGRVSYWDAYIGLLKGLNHIIDNEDLAMINSVTTAPYIRSAALAANYRFTPFLEWRLNAFFGSDGIGADVITEYDNDGIRGSVDLVADYNNYQGFLITGISASPSPVLALRATGGAGFMRTITDNYIRNDITVNYNNDFLALFPDYIANTLGMIGSYTAPGIDARALADHTIFNAQARVDLDWELGKGFIAAFGVQELYSLWAMNQEFNIGLEFRLRDLLANPGSIPPEYIDFINDPFFQDVLDIPNISIIRQMEFNSELLTHGFTTSAYGLVEYKSPGQRFGAELGLRVDHFFLIGKNFRAHTKPAFNPRLNLDFNILKNRGNITSFDITLGTGLFSSTNTLVSFIDMSRVSIADDLKFNRSWTSILGFKIDLTQGYSFNIEGYYKYVFDRSYVDADIMSSPEINATLHADGIGHVGGFDLQFQKMESRYIDGWVSYTFTWANYYDPHAGGEGVNMGGISGVSGWYYPSFHRFHNCNIVLNIKPVRWFHITTRFGFASGQLGNRTRVVGPIESYPVIYIDENGETTIIQKYNREMESLPPERNPWVMPLDIKFSFFRFNRNGRVNMEIYLAAENVLAAFPFYPFQRTNDNTRFNNYTGQEEPAGSTSGGSMFDLPIPMISFGFKWRY